MRLKANVNLVELFNDLRQKESHYEVAEDAYQQCCRIAPDGDEETDDALRTLRSVLDETRDELEQSKPLKDLEHASS